MAGGCGGAPWAPIFAGFPISDQAQADNLVGAFQYARANWPWLGGIFVFNLDFNPPRRSTDPCYDEQGSFAVQGHAAGRRWRPCRRCPEILKHQNGDRAYNPVCLCGGLGAIFLSYGPGAWGLTLSERDPAPL